MHSTLAEVKRCCKIVVSTINNATEYTEKLKEAEKDYGAFEFVSEHEAISIYSNETFYIVVEHFGNILTLWRIR